MWQRPKPELKEEDYKEFYKSITGDWEDPLFWFHTRAEGTLEYTTLFYIPAKAPLDLYQADYKGGVKLYVKRVFIMEDSKDLLPQYLRFVRGVIDSEDLPLNVSREILQQNKVLTSIKTASVKKILSELKNIAASDPEKYAQFIAEYNRPLKEGLYGDFANRETLLDLVRFKSTKVEGITSLAEARGRMRPAQTMRLERLLESDRQVPWDTWRERHLEHPAKRGTQALGKSHCRPEQHQQREHEEPHGNDRGTAE